MGAAEPGEIGQRLDVELVAAFERHPVYSQHEKVRIDVLKRFGVYSRTLTPGIMAFKGRHLTDWGTLMAASVLGGRPRCDLLYLFAALSHEGLSTGAVKG